jgi:hypothetical protein
MTLVQAALQFLVADRVADDLSVWTAFDRLTGGAAAARLGHHDVTVGTRAGMAEDGAFVVAGAAVFHAELAASVRDDAGDGAGFLRFAAVASVVLGDVAADVLASGAAPAVLQFGGVGPGDDAVQVEDVVALFTSPDLVGVLDFLAADEALEHAPWKHLLQTLSLRGGVQFFSHVAAITFPVAIIWAPVILVPCRFVPTVSPVVAPIIILTALLPIFTVTPIIIPIKAIISTSIITPPIIITVPISIILIVILAILFLALLVLRLCFSYVIAVPLVRFRLPGLRFAPVESAAAAIPLVFSAVVPVPVPLVGLLLDGSAVFVHIVLACPGVITGDVGGEVVGHLTGSRLLQVIILIRRLRIVKIVARIHDTVVGTSRIAEVGHVVVIRHIFGITYWKSSIQLIVVAAPIRHAFDQMVTFCCAIRDQLRV